MKKAYLGIRLDADTYDRAQQAAALHGQTLSAFVRAALAREVEQADKDTVTPDSFPLTAIGRPVETAHAE